VVKVDAIAKMQYEKVTYAFLKRIFNRFEAPTKVPINQNMDFMANLCENYNISQHQSLYHFIRPS